MFQVYLGDNEYKADFTSGYLPILVIVGVLVEICCIDRSYFSRSLMFCFCFVFFQNPSNPVCLYIIVAIIHQQVVGRSPLRAHPHKK